MFLRPPPATLFPPAKKRLSGAAIRRPGKGFPQGIQRFSQAYPQADLKKNPAAPRGLKVIHFIHSPYYYDGYYIYFYCKEKDVIPCISPQALPISTPA